MLTHQHRRGCVSSTYLVHLWSVLHWAYCYNDGCSNGALYTWDHTQTSNSRFGEEVVLLYHYYTLIKNINEREQKSDYLHTPNVRVMGGLRILGTMFISLTDYNLHLITSHDIWHWTLLLCCQVESRFSRLKGIYWYGFGQVKRKLYLPGELGTSKS